LISINQTLIHRKTKSSFLDEFHKYLTKNSENFLIERGQRMAVYANQMPWLFHRIKNIYQLFFDMFRKVKLLVIIKFLQAPTVWWMLFMRIT